MLTQTLINVAILVYFSVSSGHGINFDFHAGKKAAAKVEETVVLRENSLSEKCGLGLETVGRSDEEIVALQSSASGLKAALGLGQRITKQAPQKLPAANQWKDKFVLIWDGEGGVYFDGTYFPGPDPNPWACCGRAAGPVKCILLSATERRGNDASGDRFEPNSTGRPQPCIHDNPDSQITRQTSEKPPFGSQWKDKFVLIWDGDKGVYFDGIYIPADTEHPVGSSTMYCPQDPVKCMLVSPTGDSVDDAHGTALKSPSREGTTNNCYVDGLSTHIEFDR